MSTLKRMSFWAANSHRAIAGLDTAIIAYATLLAAVGAFYFYGEGLVMETSALLDEEFVFFNALSVAYNGLGYDLETMMLPLWAHLYLNKAITISFFPG